jgi:hypothetical protein
VGSVKRLLRLSSLPHDVVHYDMPRVGCHHWHCRSALVGNMISSPGPTAGIRFRWATCLYSRVYRLKGEMIDDKIRRILYKNLSVEGLSKIL